MNSIENWVELNSSGVYWTFHRQGWQGCTHRHLVFWGVLWHIFNLGVSVLFCTTQLRHNNDKPALQRRGTAPGSSSLWGSRLLTANGDQVVVVKIPRCCRYQLLAQFPTPHVTLLLAKGRIYKKGDKFQFSYRINVTTSALNIKWYSAYVLPSQRHHPRTMWSCPLREHSCQRLHKFHPIGICMAPDI